MRDARIKLWKEEFVSRMGQRWNDAGLRDVTIKLGREEFVSLMELRWSSAASMIATTMPRKEDFVRDITRWNQPSCERRSCITHGATRKRYSHNGCTTHAQKGGVCTIHRSKAPSYQQTTQHCKKQMTLFLLLFHLLTNQLIMKMRKNLIHGFGNLFKFQGSLVDTMCSYKWWSKRWS